MKHCIGSVSVQGPLKRNTTLHPFLSVHYCARGQKKQNKTRTYDEMTILRVFLSYRVDNDVYSASMGRQ